MTPSRTLRGATAPLALLAVLALVAIAAPAAHAQSQPRAPRQPTGSESGTPQVVTVRPREPLRFDVELVVPTYYDRDFWPAIRAGVELVAPTAPAPATRAPAVTRDAPPARAAAPRRPTARVAAPR